MKLTKKHVGMMAETIHGSVGAVAGVSGGPAGCPDQRWAVLHFGGDQWGTVSVDWIVRVWHGPACNGAAVG